MTWHQIMGHKEPLLSPTCIWDRKDSNPVTTIFCILCAWHWRTKFRARGPHKGIKRSQPTVQTISKFFTYVCWERVAVQLLATGRKVRGSNPACGENFRTLTDRAWVPPSLLHNGYRVYTAGKSGGVALTTHHYVAPRLKKEESCTYTPHLGLSYPFLEWVLYFT